MKRYVIYNIDDRVITNKVSGPYSSSENVYHDPEKQAVLEVADEVIFSQVNVFAGRVVNDQILGIPERPGLSYVWDTANGVWEDTTPTPKLKAIKLSEINAERERRNLSPISYQNVLFDADAEAQRNVSAWMTNIAAGQNPPAGFVWRGYDNVDHPADAAFIVGLGNAITLRGTYLYQRSWIKKAEVDALTTSEDVKAYDVTAGW